MIAYFDRFNITMTLDQAKSASHQGKCDDDVADLVKNPKIRRQLDKIQPDKIRKELAEYGAWDEKELQDDEENRLRIIWIAAGNIVEEEWEKRR